MELLELQTSAFRNVETEPIRLSRGWNLMIGMNGAGKTSLLEAIAVLGNLRTFRQVSPRQMVCHGAPGFSLRGTVRTHVGQFILDQTVSVGPPLQRRLKIDGQPVQTAQYLRTMPVFAISGSDRDLVQGSPEGRRAFLDRFIFLLDDRHIDILRTYRRILAQRNAALSQEATDLEVDAWDEALARAAMRLVVARRRGALVLAACFSETYGVIGDADAPTVEIEYRGDRWLTEEEGEDALEDLYRQRYNETRVRDRLAGFTGDGPHRHDLGVRADRRAARYVLSSGQTKTVAAALRLATLAQVEKERGERFPVVFDDVDAELDTRALARLFDYLGTSRQLFLSSTSTELRTPNGASISRYWLQSGKLLRQEASSDE